MVRKFTRRHMLAGIGVALGIAGLLTAGSALQAQARRGPGFGGARMGLMGHIGGSVGFGGATALMRGLRGLDISDSQREQIRAVFEQYRPQLQALGNQARDAGLALRAAVTADVFDEITIRDGSAALGSVQADLAVLGARVHADVVNLLTPEQRQKAAELKAERSQRIQERQERRQGRRRNR